MRSVYYIIYANSIKRWRLFSCVSVSRVVCRRTDRAGKFLPGGKDAVRATDVRAPQWPVTTCAAASRPGHLSRRLRVRHENPHQPAGQWLQRLLSGRRSSEDNLQQKRY